MIKTYHLRNLIMYGEITGAELDTLLENRAYLGALYDMRNNRSWMGDMVQSPVAMEVVTASPVAMEVVTASPVAMGAIATSPAAMGIIATSPALMGTIAASPALMRATFGSVTAKLAIWESAAAITIIAASSAAMGYLKTITVEVSTNGTSATGFNVYAGKILAVEMWTSGDAGKNMILTNKAGASGHGTFEASLRTVHINPMTTHQNAFMYNSYSSSYTVTLQYIKMDV